MANQTAMTITATMIVAQIAGVTRFELPLLGESLAARSNFISHLLAYAIGIGASAERCLDLPPERCIFLIGIVLRSRRLRGTHRIGGRKAVDQTCLERRMGVPVGALGLAGINGVLVVWRGIEFLNHVVPPSPGDNAAAIPQFHLPRRTEPTCARNRNMLIPPAERRLSQIAP